MKTFVKAACAVAFVLPVYVRAQLFTLSGTTGPRHPNRNQTRQFPARRALAALALIATSGTGAQAAPVNNHFSPLIPSYYDYSFRFTDALTNNITTGVIRGLSRNGTSSAYSVQVTASQGGFGIGEYVGNPVLNEWVVQNGVIQTAEFYGFGIANVAPDVISSSLLFTSGGNTQEAISAGHSNLSNSAAIPDGADTQLTFEVLRGYHTLPLEIWIAQPAPGFVALPLPANRATRNLAIQSAFVPEDNLAPVPLPAAGWLLLVALSGMAGLRRYRA